MVNFQLGLTTRFGYQCENAIIGHISFDISHLAIYESFDVYYNSQLSLSQLQVVLAV